MMVVSGCCIMLTSTILFYLSTLSLSLALFIVYRLLFTSDVEPLLSLLPFFNIENRRNLALMRIHDSLH